MYPVSARFLKTLAESHTPITEVTLFLANGKVEQLEHIGGSVSVDRGSQTRRTCSVQVADVNLIPRNPADKLATYGAQLRIARGVRYSDGTRELVPLGVFRVDEVSGDVDTGPVTIAGKSLEAAVADDKFTSPWRATGNAVTSITSLIQRSIPAAQIAPSVVGATVGPRTWDVEGDPWAAIVELGAAIGIEVYTDADGTFRLAELPDLLAATPAWDVASGEGGVYVSANRGMSLDGVYNGVLARGENAEAGTVASALVVDTDPGSPTYWSGPFGHRPYFYTSSALTTSGQCTAAATLKLRAMQAPNASADISTLPNPALEPGDVIRVSYPNGSRELHQVASFTVPLDAGGAFTLQTISAKEGS